MSAQAAHIRNSIRAVSAALSAVRSERAFLARERPYLHGDAVAAHDEAGEAFGRFTLDAERALRLLREALDRETLRPPSGTMPAVTGLAARTAEIWEEAKK